MAKHVGRKKILIIDDDRINRAVLAEILEDSFDVIESADIQTAYALEKKNIDLIIIDMFLQNDGFWEFLEAIKSSQECRSIPVIVIIAPDTDNMFIERAGRLGASEFITRPFSEYIIEQRISKIIDTEPGIFGVEQEQHDEGARERTSVYLEEERAKFDFFLSQTREIWFKYSIEPPVVTLTKASADKLGIPQVIENPIENSKIQSYFGDGQYERIINKLSKLSAENSFYEGELQLDAPTGKKWYRLSMYIVWSAEFNRPSSIFGMFQDIDTGYRALERLHSYEAADIQPPVEKLQLDTPELTHAQVAALMKYFKGMFEFVRLVDPEICMQFTLDGENNLIEKPQRCYTLWNKANRCENCISMIVAQTRRNLTKLEFVNDNIYNVTASYVIVEGKGYVLELASFVDHDAMFSADDKKKILSAITAHNRQLYIDPVTGIHNRRYYDDKLSELVGEFAFAMLDMDNFKQINDCFGHLAGDAALAAAAKTIKSNIRTGDELVRFGGDEFFLLFRDMPAEVLYGKLQKILNAVESMHLPEYPDLKATVSIGGAYSSGKISRILKEADIAMYRAKENKNSICIYKNTD